MGKHKMRIKGIALRILRYRCELLTPLSVVLAIFDESNNPVWNGFGRTFDEAAVDLDREGYETVSNARINGSDAIWDTRRAHATKIEAVGWAVRAYHVTEEDEFAGRVALRIAEIDDGGGEGDVLCIARGNNYQEAYDELVRCGYMLVRTSEIQGKYNVWYTVRPKNT